MFNKLFKNNLENFAQERRITFTGNEDGNSMTIDVGDTVIWDLGGSHWIKPTTENWRVSQIEPNTNIKQLNGKEARFTFNSAGIYKYECGVHPSMKGTITVGDQETTSAGTTTARPTTSLSEIPEKFLGKWRNYDVINVQRLITRERRTSQRDIMGPENYDADPVGDHFIYINKNSIGSCTSPEYDYILNGQVNDYPLNDVDTYKVIANDNEIYIDSTNDVISKKYYLVEEIIFENRFKA